MTSEESHSKVPNEAVSDESQEDSKASVDDCCGSSVDGALKSYDITSLSNGEAVKVAENGETSNTTVNTSDESKRHSTANPKPVAADTPAMTTEPACVMEPGCAIESAEPSIAEESEQVEVTPQEMVDFKVVYNKQTFNVTFPIDSTVLSLKQHLEALTDVEVNNQKIMFKGLMKDDVSLRDHKLTSGAKLMLVGSKRTDIQAVSETKAVKESEKGASAAANKEPLCKQKPHSTVLEKYGKPDDTMIGVKKQRDALPPVPLSGMYNKVGSKVRLTFKLETDQVWIGTKERTEKVALSSIKAVVSEPIEGHEEYHIMGLQLGPTEASRYWIYWVPAQYIDSIKDAILGGWQYY